MLAVSKAGNNDYSYLLDTTAGKRWSRVGIDRKAGFQAFLPGVHSEKSVCCGEFPNIKSLVNWGKVTGHSFVMVTPFGPTGYGESPFSARSSFALNPFLISPWNIKGIDINKFERKIRELQDKYPTGTGKINYGFISEKLQLFREMYENFKSRNGEHSKFKKFLEEKKYWIKDFVLYEGIKETEGYRSWKDWPNGLKNRTTHSLNSFERKFSDSLTFHAWLQWQGSMQLKAEKKYAEENNFMLMGNLPFLAAEDSADVWALREKGYFKMKLAAGAPPDMYCKKGQRWGNPPLNWKVIEADGFEYFDQKLNEAANYFDLYVLDHVFGIARLWSIPVEEQMENQGLNGFFDPKDPKGDEAIWDKQLRRLLTKMVNSNPNIQPVAENLGIGPRNCNAILKELGILGFAVPRWMKDWGNDPSRFISSSEYDKNTVAMTGIHDASFTPVWYETADTKEQEIYWKHVGMSGRASTSATPKLMRNIVKDAANSSSIYTAMPLNDLLAIKDPSLFITPGSYINKPGTAGGNWAYGYPAQFSLEKLNKDQELKAELVDINHKAKRT